MKAYKYEDYSLSNSADQKKYDDFLDETHETCSLCSQYGASRILEEVDPTAYRCGFSDWIDSEMESNPIWLCNECGSEFDNEDEADQCCMYECDSCGTWHESEEAAETCCKDDEEEEN